MASEAFYVQVNRSVDPLGAYGVSSAIRVRNLYFLEWREAHPKAPLYELQIELSEWALKAIPQESRLSYEARDRNSKRVQRHLDEIRKTKQALFFRPTIGMDFYSLYDAEIAKAIREKYELQNASKRRNLKKKEDEDDDPIEADRARERAKEKAKEEKEREE